MSFEKCGIGDKASKVQRTSCTPRRHCERRLWANAVFTEQGSSASQMTAAKVMDIISRLPGCAGQATDAVSAYIHVKMEDAQKLLKIPNQNVRCMDTSSKTWMTEVVGIYWGSCCSSWTKLTRTPTRRALVGKTVRKKHYWNLVGKRYQIGECLFVHRKQKIFLSVYVDDIKIAGRKQKLAPMWKKLVKNVDIENQHHFLITFTSDALKGNANPTRKSLDNITKCLNPIFLLEQPRKLPRWDKPRAKLQRGSTARRDMLENARWTVLRIGKQKEGATCEVSHPCLDDHQINKEELEKKQRWMVRSLLPYCIKILVLGTNW